MANRDSTQLLPMALVLGSSTLEPSPEILYADYINKDQTVASFNSLVDLGAEGGICQSTSELITTNDSLMSATNSNQFYNGTKAQQQFDNMNVISFKFDQIKNYVTSSEELTAIQSGIDNYNDKLTTLKANCRKKLLQNEAEKFNKAKHEWEGFPKTKTYRYTSYDNQDYYMPTSDSEFNCCVGDNSEEYEWEVTSSNTETINERDDTGMIYNTYYKYSVTYTIHKYKFIKYWNFFKNWDSWFDPDVKEIEALYAKVGASLPYDPALIVGPDADN